MWEDLKPIKLTKIVPYPFPENKFFKEEHLKTQVVLHHTISGPSIDGDVQTWINGKYNVGTAIIVARDGTPYQLFPSRYWAYHLGSGDHNQDRRSIGIEIDSWGGLTQGTGSLKVFRHRYFRWKVSSTTSEKFYNYYGNAVPDGTLKQFYPLGFRGYLWYEKYTDAQIQTVGELLLYWRDRYDIPMTYNDSMWELSSDAQNGKPGIWTHVSFRKDKSDCHPQPELIDMLKTLQKI